MLAEEQEEVGEFRMCDLGARGDRQSLKFRACGQHLAQAANILGPIGERPAWDAWPRLAPSDERIAPALAEFANQVREHRRSPAQRLIDPAPDFAPLIAREREHAPGRGRDREPVVDEEPDCRQDQAKARGLERQEVAGRNGTDTPIRVDRLLDRDRVGAITCLPQSPTILPDRAGSALAERQDHAKPGSVLPQVQPLAAVLSYDELTALWIWVVNTPIIQGAACLLQGLAHRPCP